MIKPTIADLEKILEGPEPCIEIIPDGSLKEKGCAAEIEYLRKELAEVKKAHRDIMEPTVKEENVIRYNIESHVAFALTKDGKIFPNAGFPGAQWTPQDESFGDHSSSDLAEGGYSLTVGARAMRKRTTTYGDQSSVEYDRYYKEGDHQGQENPAELLNSWCSFSLPDDAKEMPYSDEAAMFFFGLMKSMAEINRRVQEFTNTPKKLAQAIAKVNGQCLLPGPDQDAESNGGKGAKNS